MHVIYLKIDNIISQISLIIVQYNILLQQYWFFYRSNTNVWIHKHLQTNIYTISIKYRNIYWLINKNLYFNRNLSTEYKYLCFISHCIIDYHFIILLRIKLLIPKRVNCILTCLKKNGNAFYVLHLNIEVQYVYIY